MPVFILVNAVWPDWAKLCCLGTFTWSFLHLHANKHYLFSIQKLLVVNVLYFPFDFWQIGYSFGHIYKNWAIFDQSSGRSVSECNTTGGFELENHSIIEMFDQKWQLENVSIIRRLAFEAATFCQSSVRQMVTTQKY